MGLAGWATMARVGEPSYWISGTAEKRTTFSIYIWEVVGTARSNATLKILRLGFSITLEKTEILRKSRDQNLEKLPTKDQKSPLWSSESYIICFIWLFLTELFFSLWSKPIFGWYHQFTLTFLQSFYLLASHSDEI